MNSKQKSDLVVLGYEWQQCSPAYQQLFMHLAQDRQILWINIRDSHSIQQSDNYPAGIISIHLKSLPARLANWLPNWHQQWLSRQIGDIVESLNLHQPLLLLLTHEAYPIAQRLNKYRMIYLRSRKQTAQPQDVTAENNDDFVIAKADLVIAETVDVARQLPAVKTSLLKGEGWIEPMPRPRDLPRGRPVAGFHGPLDQAIDWELLTQAAKRRPDWYWVLIGPRVDKHLDEILQLRNVFWLGEKSFEQLAAYRQHWQLTIMPYRNTTEIRARIPMALQQALHSDKPLVVTADFAGLPAFKPLVSKVHTMQELSELLPIVADPRLSEQSSASGIRSGWLNQNATAGTLCELGAQEVDGLLDTLG